MLGFLGQLKARSGGTFRIEVLDVLSEPERAVVLQRETATRDGRALDVVAAVEFEIHHGKITEVTVYQADTYAFDEFWADGSGRKDSMDWGDIESELDCSAREAGAGYSLWGPNSRRGPRGSGRWRSKWSKRRLRPAAHRVCDARNRAVVAYGTWRTQKAAPLALRERKKRYAVLRCVADIARREGVVL